MADDKGEQGFTVSDKRHFTTEGDVREDDVVGTDEKAAAPSPAAAAPAQGEPAPEAAAQIDFVSYILTYETQGLVLLGEVPNPYTNKNEENLEAARHVIDILALLQEKTHGNLTSEEELLLDDMLYRLRMKYMAKTNRIKL